MGFTNHAKGAGDGVTALGVGTGASYLCCNKSLLSHLFVLDSPALRCQSSPDIGHVKETVWVFLAEFKELLLAKVSFLQLAETYDKLLFV